MRRGAGRRGQVCSLNMLGSDQSVEPSISLCVMIIRSGCEGGLSFTEFGFGEDNSCSVKVMCDDALTKCCTCVVCWSCNVCNVL